MYDKFLENIKNKGAVGITKNDVVFNIFSVKFKVQTPKKTSYFEPNPHYWVKPCLRHSVDHQGDGGLDGAELWMGKEWKWNC